MKELVFSPAFGNSFHKFYTKSWAGFVIISTVLMMVVLSLIFNAGFLYWKSSFLPFSEKSILAISIEIMTIHLNETIFKLSFVFMLWAFLRLNMNSVFAISLYPFEKLWVLFGGTVYNTHGHCGYDPHDWYDVIEIKIFRFKKSEFYFASEYFSLGFALMCLLSCFHILSGMIDWWSMFLVGVSSVFFWNSTNNFRYAVCDFINDRDSDYLKKRYSEKQNNKLLNGGIYFLCSVFIFMVSMLVSPQFRKSMKAEYSKITKVEICTLERCIVGNYIAKSDYGHIIKIEADAVAIPHENLRQIKFLNND